VEENTVEKLEWSAPEYMEKKQGTDWFWALGIIILASAVASVIFGNYFFAILIVLGGILLIVFAIKKPEMVFYEINDKGIKMRDRLYPFENIKSFWIHIDPSAKEGGVNHIFFIRSERIFMPIITIPIEEKYALQIRDIMLSYNIPEEEMKEHPSVQIMEKLGF
jgi:hypothetical protein